MSDVTLDRISMGFFNVHAPGGTHLGTIERVSWPLSITGGRVQTETRWEARTGHEHCHDIPSFRTRDEAVEHLLEIKHARDRAAAKRTARKTA